MCKLHGIQAGGVIYLSGMVHRQYKTWMLNDIKLNSHFSFWHIPLMMNGFGKGTWNVKSLFWSGALKVLHNIFSNLDFDTVALQETELESDIKKFDNFSIQ